MARTLVAGVDTSTQSCKVVVRDAGTGELVREGRAPHPDGTEIDPHAWDAALREAISAAGGLLDVAAIGIGGQQHGMVLLDSDGAVVRDALLWNDTRSAQAASDLVDELGAQVWADATGSGPVAFGDSSTYTTVPGVLTFRGNNFRDAPVYGSTDVKDKRLQVVWTQTTGDVYAEGSHWAGAGWTGQPLLVNWPKATKQAMSLTQAQIDDPDFVEVVYPVVDGHVYRLDLATGQFAPEVIPPVPTDHMLAGFEGRFRD